MDRYYILVKYMWIYKQKIEIKYFQFQLYTYVYQVIKK